MQFHRKAAGWEGALCDQVRPLSGTPNGTKLRLGQKDLNCVRSDPTMAVTRESLAGLLANRGGKMKKSDFVSEFKSLLESDDPAERRRRRDNFKKLVNQVACVKDLDGVRLVVLKRGQRPLLDSRTAEEEENKEVEDIGGGGGEKIRPTYSKYSNYEGRFYSYIPCMLLFWFWVGFFLR